MSQRPSISREYYPEGHPLHVSQDAELDNLCDFGARQIQAGKYDEIKFNLFNKYEVDHVRERMDRLYPTVLYSTNRVV